MLSIVGSSYVIYRILTTDRSPNLRGRNSRSYSNLLLCLCIADFITSLAYFLSTWPIPKNNLYSDYIWGEAGNQITCSIQGAMGQFGGMASIMYTCGIILHFLLGIRYKWLSSDLEKIAPFIHILCFLVPAGSAIFGWLKTVYNPTVNMCFLQSYPIGCGSTSGVACIRGANVKLYTILFGLLPIFLGLFFIIISMTLIYMSVYNQDQEMSRFRFGQENERRMSKEAFSLACQYVAAFFVAFVPPAISMTTILIIHKELPFGWRLFRSLVSPLQGFLNAFVYSNDLKRQFLTMSQTMASRIRSVRGSMLAITNDGGLEDEEVESQHIVSENQAAETTSSVLDDNNKKSNSI